MAVFVPNILIELCRAYLVKKNETQQNKEVHAALDELTINFNKKQDEQKKIENKIKKQIKDMLEKNHNPSDSVEN